MLLSITASTMLVGCNGGSSTSTNTKQQQQNLKNGTDNIEGIWGAVTSSDSGGKDGQTNFLINNNTNTKLIRLGCLSSGGNMPLSDSGNSTIDEFTYQKNLKNTNSLWKGDAEGFIADKLSAQESVLLTISGDGKGHNTMSPSSELTCYYKLDDGNNEPMFIKLVGHNEAYMVSSVLMQDIDKPFKDLAKTREDNPKYKAWMDDGGVAAVMAGTVTAFNMLNSTKIDPYIDILINNITGEVNLRAAGTSGIKDLFEATKIDSKFSDKMIRFIKFNDGDVSRFTRAYQTDILEKYGSGILSPEEIQREAGAFENALRKALCQLPEDAYDKNTILKFALSGGIDSRQVEISGMTGYGKGFYTKSEPYKFKSKLLEVQLSPEDKTFMKTLIKRTVGNDAKNFAKLKDPETWKMFGEAAAAKDVEHADLVAYFKDIQLAMDEYKYGPLAARRSIFSLEKAIPYAAEDTARAHELFEAIDAARDVKLASNMAIGFSTLAEFGIGVFGVQALLDYYTLPPSVGSYDTSIASFKWEAVTQEDVRSWNAKHTNPEEQLQANTIVDTNGTYKSSVAQSAVLTYNNTAQNTDKQKVYSIDTTYIDTPFLRATTDYSDDPWFGDVKKGSRSNGNALIQTNLSELTTEPDFIQQIQRQALKSSGFGAVIVPVITAPVIVGQPTLSTINTGVGGQMLGDSLLGARPAKLMQAKVKTKLGDVDGYILPEDGKLTIPIKVANTAGFSDMKYSRGLTSSYIPIDDGSRVYLSKSMKGYNNLIGLMPTIYSAYTCTAPYTYGQTCNYELALTRGTTGNTKSIGKIYLADAYGEELAIPVFVGYNLILDQQEVTLDDNQATFVAKVATPSGYSKMSVANLPEGAKIIKGCNNKLSQGDSCAFKLDFSGVAEGTYPISVVGILPDGTTGSNDIEQLNVVVETPWKPNN